MPQPTRIPIAHLPTPLEPMPRFSATMASDVPVWIKRDDCTGLAFGGNKARKLQYLMAAAKEAGADTIVSFGGVQSNHARATAAAARKMGLDCTLLLAGSPPEEVTGNLLLDRLLGATLTFLSFPPSELTAERVEEAFASAEDRLRSKGRRPYRIPAGGSTPLALFGYRDAFDEAMGQAAGAGVAFSHMIVAFGTGGTLAGLHLGNELAGRPVTLTGISVAPPGMPAAVGIPSVQELAESAARLAGQPVPDGATPRVLYDYTGPAYAVPTTEGIEAIRGLARTEGILLEPVYTGKAMAGLLDLCRRGVFDRSTPVLFWHTGGTPALFAYHRALGR